MAELTNCSIQVATGDIVLEGDLSVPAGARGVVLFAHGSGSSRHSPRNRYVAEALQQAALATLLLDLLTLDEEAVDMESAELRFDIGLLAERLSGATDWQRTRRPGTCASATSAPAPAPPLRWWPPRKRIRLMRWSHAVDAPTSPAWN